MFFFFLLLMQALLKVFIVFVTILFLHFFFGFLTTSHLDLQPRIEPVPSELEGEVLSTGSPEKSFPLKK